MGKLVIVDMRHEGGGREKERVVLYIIVEVSPCE
jgi:hypothetical protein